MGELKSLNLEYFGFDYRDMSKLDVMSLFLPINFTTTILEKNVVIFKKNSLSEVEGYPSTPWFKNGALRFGITRVWTVIEI